MKKQILLATLFYTLSVLILFWLVKLFLDNELSFTVASFLTILITVSFGYLFNSYILNQKFKIDNNLLHLTKEILHELNIPLSTIQANSKLLKRTLKNNEKGLKRLSRIDDSSKRLERLYRELVYSIKKEIHIIEKEQIELEALIQERIDIFKLQKRNFFILKLDRVTIYVDKIGFEKMFDNIITNAMKYSDKESSITIELKENILMVEDKGVGIDEIELIAIYERYYQADYHMSGEGIGLSLVKAYCDDEKIGIGISSQKGVGTKVTFNLLNVTR